MPAGISSSIFLFFCTTPSPSHTEHGFFTNFPSPLHFPHVICVTNIPNGVLWLLLRIPVPSHWSHVLIEDSESAPVPWQCSHFSVFGMTIIFFAPNATSSNLTSMSYL